MRAVVCGHSAVGLSAGAYDRLLKVARTSTDMEGSQDIRTPHVAEAIHYRSLDREFWEVRGKQRFHDIIPWEETP